MLWDTTDFQTCSGYARHWDFYLVNKPVIGYDQLAFLNLVLIEYNI